MSNKITPSKERATAAYSVTVKLQIANKPGSLASIIKNLGDKLASIAEIKLILSNFEYTEREITINCRSVEHSKEMIALIKTLSECKLLEWHDDVFKMHENGKMGIAPKSALATTDELSRAYSPGVARVCNAIKDDPSLVYKYTLKANSVAVISDGSAVLGLGNIGAKAALPVMEGKAVLFKQFAGIDGYPICLETQNVEEIITIVKNIATSFAGINLEDISAPRCFEIEERLQAICDIPIFHDDQHGTAIVTLAGVMNATKLLGKKLCDMKVIVNGFGSGGVACVKILYEAGIKNIIPCDTTGIVYRGRTQGMNKIKEEVIQYTNPDNIKGTLSDAIKNADMFLGCSAAGVLTRDMVKSMAKSPVVFALANPNPEILPDEVHDIVGVIATGRSDYANQVNNVLCFPGLFRGALDAGATRITANMKLAAAKAIASCISAEELAKDFIIPNIFNKEVTKRVAEAVREAAVKDGVVRAHA